MGLPIINPHIRSTKFHFPIKYIDFRSPQRRLCIGDLDKLEMYCFLAFLSSITALRCLYSFPDNVSPLRYIVCMHCFFLKYNAIVAKCPGIWPCIPVVSRFISALSRNPARLHKLEVWHKHKLSILSNITRCLLGVAIHNCPKWVWSPKVGVVRKNFACALCALILFSTLSRSLLL